MVPLVGLPALRGLEDSGQWAAWGGVRAGGHYTTYAARGPAIYNTRSDRGPLLHLPHEFVSSGSRHMTGGRDTEFTIFGPTAVSLRYRVWWRKVPPAAAGGGGDGGGDGDGCGVWLGLVNR